MSSKSSQEAMVAQVTSSNTSCRGYMIRCGSRSSESSEKRSMRSARRARGSSSSSEPRLKISTTALRESKHPRNHTSPSIQNPIAKSVNLTSEPCRARAVLLTLTGWTSPRIAEAFGVREDTVRLWRSDFAGGGIEALKASVAPGPAPVKSEMALRVVTPLLEQPVADRRNWTIPRLRAEIEAREGVRISRSQLSKALRKKSSAGGGHGIR